MSPNRPSIVTNPPPGRNKYELAIVAAREARRMNHQLRLSGETETSSAKVTTLALARTVEGEVGFHYTERDKTATVPPVE